jgi:hypothetical protein
MSDDEADTAAICRSCGKVAIKAVPAVPDVRFVLTLEQCSFGDCWSWCATKLQLERNKVNQP